MTAVVAAFNQEKALVGAFSVIVKNGCGTDGSFHSTTPECGGEYTGGCINGYEYDPVVSSWLRPPAYLSPSPPSPGRGSQPIIPRSPTPARAAARGYKPQPYHFYPPMIFLHFVLIQ